MIACSERAGYFFIHTMQQPWKNAWVLMRIPFSLFLMPVFWLAISMLPLDAWNGIPVFFVFLHLHLLLYPASNGYNSIVDKDDSPIGGLENPPPVNLQLQMLVLVFDVLALVLAFFIGLEYGFCVCVYWMVSRAYSHPVIRLKKYPVISWLAVALFQGGWTVLMVWAGVVPNHEIFDASPLWIWPLVATTFFAGSYPVTQIYQHEADRKRGDVTLSSLLGIRGTLIFALGGLMLGSLSLVVGLWINHEMNGLPIILACSLPSFFYFSGWMRKVFSDPAKADFRHTMLFNKISSLGLSMGFLGHLLLKFMGISILLQP